MTLTYAEIFRQRGDRYHRAMLDFPQARRAEFAQLFTHRAVRPNQRVLDLPSGGGYLARHLPPSADLVSLELTDGFGTGVDRHRPDLPWSWGRFDHAVCLAALHHIDDQSGFLAHLLDKLQPGGALHLADVAADSGIGRFLDGFVGRFNRTGHEGRYLPRTPGFYSALGEVERLAELDCPWEFDSEADMVAFCTQLFGLVACPADALLRSLDEHVGIEAEHRRRRLNWRLIYADIRPRTP